MISIIGFIAANCLAADDNKKTDSKAEKIEKSNKAAKPGITSKEPDRNYLPTLDGKGRTSMFGVEGVGYKFVYVIDRSGSMGGDGNAALKAAKAELLASIKKLESTHSFQIVFYNDTPTMFNPAGNGLAVFATDRNKDLAERFLDSISAQGGTEHEAALRMALKLKPDVIFWLTDADRPEARRRPDRAAQPPRRGHVINTIEFGSGPQKGKGKFPQENRRSQRRRT